MTVQSPRTAWHLWVPPAVSEVLLGPGCIEGQGPSLRVVGPQRGGYCGRALGLEGVVKEAMMTFWSLGNGVGLGAWGWVED